MIKVSVPATSANLCVGFDTLGIAFNMYNSFLFEKNDIDDVSAFEEKYQSDNLILKAYKAFYEEFKLNYIPVKIMLESQEIPSERGLGSSATCVVAGVMGANVISGANYSKDKLLGVCAKLEGHPDNALPALVGGLCAAFKERDNYYYVKYDVASSLKFYSLIPPFSLKTSLSRSVLPDSYKREDVVNNLARIVNLPYAFKNGDIELIKAIFNDRIHEPYRLKLIKNAAEIKKHFKDSAVCISGAGSCLLLVTTNDIEEKQILDFEIKKVDVDIEGVKVYEV